MLSRLGLAITFVLLTPHLSAAAIYDFNGTVTQCSPTCDSFSSLAIGSQVTGQWLIATTPGGPWTFGDVGGFSALVSNPAAPVEPYDGTNPTTANPLPLTDGMAPIVATDGSNTTGGTSDPSNNLDSGRILHQFVVPPFSVNDFWMVFELGPGGSAIGRLCLLYLTVGCVPDATQSAVIEGTFTLGGTVSAVPSTWGAIKMLYR